MTTLPQSPAAASPVRRQRSTSPVGLLVCLAGAVLLVLGALTGSAGMLVVTVVLQAAVIASWWRALDPPGPTGVLVVSAGVAVAADAVQAVTGSAADLTGVLGLGVVATVIAQLVRGVARTRVVEAVAATLGLAVAVVALALLPVTQDQVGRDALLLAAVAAGAGLALARLVDLVAIWPRVVDTVGRGGLGLLVAAVVGAGIGALVATTAGTGLSTWPAALVGLVIAVVAVLVDIGGACLAVDLPRRSWAFGLPPLLAVVAVAALAYVVLPQVGNR